MRRLGLLVLLLAALFGLANAAGALADGDPGSDELLSQTLFAPPDAGFSIAQQESLGRLLAATTRVGVPVRVAVIARQDDLGFYTQLWKHPQTYAASYLGIELEDVFAGQLLVVMPNGYGVYWHGHSTTAAQSALAHVAAPGSSRTAALFSAALTATQTLERSDGVSPARLAQAARASTTAGAGAVPNSAAETGGGAAAAKLHTSTGSAGSVRRTVSPWVVVLVLLGAVTSVFWAPVLWRRRTTSLTALVRLAPGGENHAVRRALGFAAVGMIALVALAVVIHSSGGGPQLAFSAQANPNLDAGTSLTPARAAPNFTLVDESGHRVSLSQYRGKVVILSFVDDECQTICPLTTQAMLDAKRSLGAAGKNVVLLGVDANWRSTQVADVLNYTQFHGLTGQWHFLTGSLPQLNQVWSDYHLNELKLIEKKHGDTNVIDHVVETYMIDPEGRLRTAYQTETSYAAIPQLGQLLARDASRLLPSHPRVETHYSYATVQGTAPTSTVTLPRVGGGSLTLGPGHPHVYVFFDTWDGQNNPIASELDELNAYAARAKRAGLPPPVAVDEGSVEQSPQALGRFLTTLRQPLNYPVIVDKTGRLADGYGVQGEPWFVITAKSGQIAWYREIYTSTWPTDSLLTAEAGAALETASVPTPSAAAIKRQLAASPAPLAKLHAQAATVLSGGMSQLQARIRKLRGYPIVVNVWYPSCPPCQREAGLLANAAAGYGRQVAFIGADIEGSSTDATEFMRQHDLSYPTYLTQSTSLDALLVGGLIGTPTTIFINRAGKVVGSNIGPYLKQSVLNADVQKLDSGG
jgi:cytochrome oxidase Cu insertion factor (SCO1/SenC/PrrC family)/thiol-disulfide isomerase/thioredoxin